MNLQQRAAALQQLGFFAPEEDLKALVQRAQNVDGVDAKEAPATALLMAGGRLLEILADEAVELADYEVLLKKIETFCGGAFTVSDVSAEEMEEWVEEGEGEDEAEDAEDAEGEDFSFPVRLLFRVDGHACEAHVTHGSDLVDLTFLTEIDEALARKKESRRLCPLVELMDDTSRYVFIEPVKMDTAEEKDLFAAPDFEA